MDALYSGFINKYLALMHHLITEIKEREEADMSEFRERLLAIEENQRGLLRETQALLKEYESSDLIRENERLRRETQEDRRALDKLRSETLRRRKENAELRSALSEQILDEKLNILRLSNRKLETYFAGEDGLRVNRLKQFEEAARERIRKMMLAARRLTDAEQQEFRHRLDELSRQLDHSLEMQRRRNAAAKSQVIDPMNEEYDRLGQEGVDEATIQRRIRQNRIEMKIGLNWINRLAILLILIAVGTAFRYTYAVWFNDYMRGSIFFLLGALLLGGGEWLYRRKRRTFALGLLGGGTAVLYGSIFYSYFLLGIIGMTAALLLSVLVTSTTVLLSLRYESRTICTFGLVGGYLPLLSYGLAEGLEGPAVYAAMGYLLLLNVLLLIVSLHKRWTVVAYVSFVLNTVSMLLLVALADSVWIGAGYAFVTFLMYLVSTLAYPMRFKQKLAEGDVVLLGVNTWVSCGVMYALLQSAGAIEFRGLLALLFGLLYLGLGRLAEKRVPEEKNTRLLFDITALIFAILIVPFQLGGQWSAMGWLAEACVLAVYGSRIQSKLLERTGWVVMALCIGAFMVIDLPANVMSNWMAGADIRYFAIKYTFITLGTVGLAVFYAYEWQRNESQKQNPGYYGSGERQLLLVFRYAALLNLWFYALYEALRLYDAVRGDGGHHQAFYRTLLIAAITALLSIGLSRFTLIRDRIVDAYAFILYLLSCLMGVGLMLTNPVLEREAGLNGAGDYLALLLLLAANVLIFWSGNRRLQHLVRSRPEGGEWYPVGVAAYGLVMLTALLNVQLHVDNAGMVYSLAYLLIALTCIVYGFRRRYVYIRRLGLALTLFCTAKLLVFDLGLNGAGSRIIAYFAAGFILLGISYMYQRVSNRLEEEAAGGGRQDANDNI
ncbi:hypothetical protein B9G55_08805 [Saccharibacillus sp. O16]|nr:hypothetical protein B9G55_08805 [Saccharibacillus sp. O16]